jgi:hypothetical protein
VPEQQRLQNPPESIATTLALTCSVCVVVCDTIQLELRQVKKWTESSVCRRGSQPRREPPWWRPRRRAHQQQRRVAGAALDNARSPSSLMPELPMTARCSACQPACLTRVQLSAGGSWQRQHLCAVVVREAMHVRAAASSTAARIVRRVRWSVVI